jgi:hypothetical protein
MPLQGCGEGVKGRMFRAECRHKAKKISKRTAFKAKRARRRLLGNYQTLRRSA